MRQVARRARNFAPPKLPPKRNARIGQFQAKPKLAMEGEGDDDEDPDGLMLKNGSLIQHFLVVMRVNASEEEDILAPFPNSAPPSSARWRMSDPDTLWTQHVYEVGGQDTPTVLSHRHFRPFLSIQNVPAGSDDDFLAPTPYTAPPRWKKSETEQAGKQQVDRIEVGGWGLEVVGVRGLGDMRGENTGNRLEQHLMHQRGGETRGLEQYLCTRGEGTIASWGRRRGNTWSSHSCTRKHWSGWLAR